MPPEGPQFDARPPVTYDGVTLFASVVLILLAVVAWVDVIRTGIGMTDDMGMDMGTMSHGSASAVGFVAAWGIMMTAMMLPSALPLIALYGATRPRMASPVTRAGAIALFTAVYLAFWAVSGAPVYLAERALEAATAEQATWFIAGVLIVAGAYQLSPLKQACLRACRTPLGFFLGHWRPGLMGNLGMAAAHAAYCLGCCWALMVVLVAAGAMGLSWVFLIAALVAAEKLAPRGEWIARVAGAALVLLGIAVALKPDLGHLLRGGGSM